MSILRITRTYPEKSNKSIGLQSYMFSKYSTMFNYIFTKKNGFKKLKLKNTKVFQIKYFEINLQNQNYAKIIYILSLSTKLFANIIFFLKIIKSINKKEIKIVHIHNINFLLTGFLLKLFWKKRTILSLGGTDIIRLQNKILFNKLLNKVDCIVTVSKKIKDEFLKIYRFKKKIIVINNGIDINNFKFKKKKNIKNIFISIGHIRWQKDYLNLIKAANILVKKKYFVKFYIVGKIYDDVLFLKLKKYINENNLNKNIFFLGFKNNQEIKKLLYQSKALIISSKSEGFPKVVLEAMSCGTPIITTDVGDLKKIISKCGIFCKKENSKLLAKSIIAMIKTKKYNQMTLQCKEKSSLYDWKVISNNINKIYENR
jgi:glycosyltransferase involved in cell wall biosynthesis